MIPRDCKRLAEVDFPIAVVSKHAAREKSIRHGHLSTLHLWWARRPLASCRAMLLALLLPDPCDPHCPSDFKSKAREILRAVPGRVGKTDDDLRAALLRFIGDFADWDHAANSTYMEAGRGLVKAAHPEEMPLVVDPFAGGGSIPLEALRLGCDTFASDLNPVACLILKATLEDIPKHGRKLAEDLRRVGAEIKQQTEKELTGLYPKDSDGATPIAYLWARTVCCESPNCGAEIPLIRSFWLCTKAKRRRALRHQVVRSAGGTPRVEFGVFQPSREKDVHAGTTTRARATCLACGAVLSAERVRAQLTSQHGGADVVFERLRRKSGARMLAVATLQSGEPGRHYRQPTERDYEVVCIAQERLAAILDEWERGGKQGLCPVPDEMISLNEIRRISVPIYGMTSWGDLFAARQKVALVTLGRVARERSQSETAAVRTAMAIVVSKLADYGSAQATWVSGGEFVRGTFGRQAIGMVWDWTEAVPWTDSSGNFDGALDWVVKVAEAWPGSGIGQTQPANAAEHPLPDQSAPIWFTDPPYYDAVPYAHLSDFFYVWLRRMFEGTSPAAFGSTVTPKDAEIVVDRPHALSHSKKDVTSYQIGMARAFAEGRRVLRESGIGCVVFAHKTTEGWEALLSGMISGGWTITSSWPIATERGSRVNARDTASLATSVHLVCRPRPDDAPTGDWAEVISELPGRVADWIVRLEREGVRGADLVFACIGPALEIFSRYARVETPDGREVPLPEYLEKVWEVVGRAALEQVLGTAEAQARNGGAGALEEDARLTALFLWTIKSTASENSLADNETKEDEDTEDDDEDSDGGKKTAKGFSLVFDIVRRFAQPLGVHLETWQGRIINIEKGVVRLLPVSERARQLFGQEGAAGLAARIERAPQSAQLELFPAASEALPKVNDRGKRAVATASVESAGPLQATTLDRVHAAMLLQASGRANALRALLAAEKERGPDFLRLANALSALVQRG